MGQRLFLLWPVFNPSIAHIPGRLRVETVQGLCDGLENSACLCHELRDEQLLLRNAYLVAEHGILRDQIKGRLLLRDAERPALAEVGKKLGKQAFEEVANVTRPDTIWAGIARWRKSSTVPPSASPAVAPASTRSWKTWCASLRSIARGGMTSVPVPWALWGREQGFACGHPGPTG